MSPRWLTLVAALLASMSMVALAADEVPTPPEAREPPILLGAILGLTVVLFMIVGWVLGINRVSQFQSQKKKRK